MKYYGWVVAIMPVTFTAGSGFATFEVDVGTKSYSFAKKEQIAVEDI